MHLPSWFSSATLVATLSTRAMAAAVLTPSNITQNQATTSTGPIELLVPDSASSMEVFAQVDPLFSSGRDQLKPWGLTDPLYHVTSSNSPNLTDNCIAYISCDASAYSGYLGASDAFNTALAVNATAVLLYSISADYCNITAVESSYAFIYTMTSAADSQTLLDRIEAASTELPVHGLINFKEQVDTNNATSGGHGSGTSQSSSNSSSTSAFQAAPTTAVAMIILYSITGVITALFLVIIISGAVRAHRHPERYGPRSQVGRTRQSRARGLAIAMLDTIPIVKFGEREPPKQVVDIELAGDRHGAVEEMGMQHETVVAGQNSATTSPEPHPHGLPRPSTQSARSGIAAASNVIESTTSAEGANHDAPGCSICTEDFEIGEDLRVLPCDHQFHPACIDPWLLNVSGTCPLCRIDLNPRGSTTEPADEATAQLPPPIDGGDATVPSGRPRIGMRQSFLIGLGLGRVHDTTREQRLNAVRLLRIQQNQARVASQRQRERDAAEERGRRRRFRERFGIRTSRRGQEGDVRDETVDADADAAAGPPQEHRS